MRCSPRSNCGSKSSLPRPASSEVLRPRRELSRFPARNPVIWATYHLATILSVTTRRYIRPARTELPSALHALMGWGLGKIENVSAVGKRAFHERPAARIFSQQAAGLEGRDPARVAHH